MWMTRVSIRNPVFATMLAIALLVVGVLAYLRLPVDQNPDVDYPVVWITTLYPGASAEVVATEVTRRIEEELRSLGGVRTLTSTSLEGRSEVELLFELGTDTSASTQSVRDRLAALRADFERGVEDPQVLRFDPTRDPFMQLTVSSESRDLRELTSLTDRVILPRLQSVPSVGRATRHGGVEREVQIFLRPDALEALGIAVEPVLDALARASRSLPVGRVLDGRSETLVTLRGAIEDPRQFGEIIVAQRGGAPVRLADVAQIADGARLQASSAQLDGAPALGIELVRVAGSNTIGVAEGVRHALDELAPELPADVSVRVRRDNSEWVRSSVHDVESTLWEGALLTIAVVFLFLRSWRSTVITGVALPLSLLGTFAVMYALGISINGMSLMGLSLSIGIVIDDAIVVRENIVRHVARGADHRRAALEATEEIGLAVLATTSTIVAVFLPVAFMGGIIGQYFFDFGITVAAAVVISLGVSFTLDPMLSSVWPDPSLHGPSLHGRSAPHGEPGLLSRSLALPVRALEAVQPGYRAALRWAFAHRPTVLALALLACASSFALVPWIGIEFEPQSEPDELHVRFDAPPGATLGYCEAKARQVALAVRELPDVASTYARITAGAGGGADVTAVLVPRERRTRPGQVLKDELRARVARIGGVEARIGNRWKPLEVRVLGRDPEVLERLSAEVMTRMRRIPGVVDIETSLQERTPSLAIELDRSRASDLGVDVAAAASTLRTLIAGQTAAQWAAPDGESLPVTVLLSRSASMRAAELEQLALPSERLDAQGLPRMVPLRQFGRVTPSSAPVAIARRDLRRVLTVSANVQDRPAGDVSLELGRELQGIPLDAGYRLELGGTSEDLSETAHHASISLALGVLFIYLILASQFGSFLQPLAILASLPLSLVGVLLALLAARSTINLFSMIGVLMLMGLVTKNAILLVDFIARALEQGRTPLAAALEAGSVRLRPIAMTTLAMIFGMLPLALGAGGEERAPMAQAVIGGLLSSTLLTLIVVPVLHGLLHDATQWLLGGARAPVAAAAAVEPGDPGPIGVQGRSGA